MQKPILCIGRSYGSGGRGIGEKLAQKLAVPCYDKLLIEKATRKTGIDAEVLSENDERLPSFMLSGNSFADTASMMRSFYSETQQVNDAVHQTILRLAGQGPCVFVGRCASAVLKGAKARKMIEEALELTEKYGIIIREALNKGITDPAEEAVYLIRALGGTMPPYLFMALFTVREYRKEWKLDAVK